MAKLSETLLSICLKCKKRKQSLWIVLLILWELHVFT